MKIFKKQCAIFFVLQLDYAFKSGIHDIGARIQPSKFFLVFLLVFTVFTLTVTKVTRSPRSFSLFAYDNQPLKTYSDGVGEKRDTLRSQSNSCIV